MKLTKTIPATLLATAALLATAPQNAEAHHGYGPAIVFGGLAGLGAGIAIADGIRPKRIYYDGYVPPYQPGYYGPYFNQTFSPAGGVVCYPAQQLCYNNNGSVANRWTYRVYGN